MPRSWWHAAVAVGLALVGCGADDEATFGSGGRSSSSSGTGAASSGSGGYGAGGPDGVVVYGVGNVDDDDGSGQADWADGWVEGDNDIATLVLPSDFVAEVQASDSLELSLSGDVEAIRVWRAGTVVLGPDPSWQVITSATLPGSAATEPLQVEFADFRVAGNLHLRHLAGTTEVDAIDVPLLSSPLLLANHSQPAEQVWVVNTGDNQPVVQGFQAALGSMVTVVNNPDRWVQDELEWGVATAPGMRLNVAVDSIRDRELDAWVKSLKAPDLQPITWGVAGTDTTQDKFGNLETSAPPDGQYPLGRIYFGAINSVGPNEILQSFLDAQQVQAPLRLDVEWLCIGHVDEYLSFIPDPSSAKGFKLLFADVDAAYAVLESMNPSTSLPRYASSYGYGNVASLVNDASLRAFNEEIQTDHLDPTLAQLKAELALDDSDVILVPSLFERVSNCWYSNAWMEAVSLIPGLVNLTVVNPEGGPIHIFFPDPFMRSSVGDPGSDPIIAALVAALPSGYELHFLDDWYSYHLASGEVHCGSNVMRTPTPPWWETATHLLGGP